MAVVKNFFHASLQANDYEAALDFYCNKLGFEQLFELNIGQFKDMLQLGEHDENDGTPWLTYLRVAPDQYIEMFNGAITPPLFQKEPIPRKELSPLQCVILGTEDVAATCAMLQEKRIPVTDGYICDPNGCRLRIVQAKAPVKPSAPRIFTSLVGVALAVNDVKVMAEHLEKMTFEKKEEKDGYAKLEVGEFGQYVELVKAPAFVETKDDDLLGHFALQIYSVPETTKTWGANGAYCCPQPFMPDVVVPADDTATGNVGLDGCEIIWMICPEGNKVEVMVEPDTTMQKQWESKHSY